MARNEESVTDPAEKAEKMLFLEHKVGWPLEGREERAEIIRAAYAETQATADAREQRLVELAEEAYLEGGHPSKMPQDWKESPVKAELDSLLHDKEQ